MIGANSLSRTAKAAFGVTLTALATVSMASPAQAMTGAALAASFLFNDAQECSGLIPAGAPTRLGEPAPSKASQILGGTSALDAIRAQQQSPSNHPLLAGNVPAKFEPAAAPAPRATPGCSVATPFSIEPQYSRQPISLAIPRAELTMPGAGSFPRSNRVLGSRMVPIGGTGFDAQWRRVSANRTDLAPTLAKLGVTGRDRGEVIAIVNSWVNRRIGHAEDSELFGRSDYWADAATTLRLGRGDCEDFALLKMGLLEAAGVKREDMMLTLARDLIRRRDHAVLLVKTDEGFVMLDNVGTLPLDASLSHGYRPIMSLGAKQSFLHGY